MKSLFTLFLLFFVTLLFHSSIVFAQVSEEWVVRHDDGGGRNVVTDEEGNLYVTGAAEGITGISYDDSDYLTSKYNNSGELQWVARYNGPRSDMDQPRAIAVDTEGNVYVTGRSFGARSNLDYATLKPPPTCLLIHCSSPEELYFIVTISVYDLSLETPVTKTFPSASTATEEALLCPLLLLLYLLTHCCSPAGLYFIVA